MRRMFSEKQVKELSNESIKNANDGTINKALGLDSNGNLVKGEISGGTQLYKHRIEMPEAFGFIELVSTKKEPYQSINELVNSNIIFGNNCIVNDFGIILTCICGVTSNLGIYQLVGYSINDTAHDIKYYNLDPSKMKFPSAVTPL